LGRADDRYIVWDAADGRELRRYGPRWFPSPDLTRIALDGEDGTLHFADAATGRELWARKANDSGVQLGRVSPGRSRLFSAARGGEPIRVWETATGRRLSELIGQDAAVWDMRASADGRWLATSSGPNGAAGPAAVRVWDLATGRLVRTIAQRHVHPI